MKKHIIIEALLTPILIFLFKNIEIGVLVAFSIGLLKECIDEIFKRLGLQFWIINGTGFCVNDLIKDVIGIFIGLLMFNLIVVIFLVN